jgi:hypothetical protein
MPLVNGVGLATETERIYRAFTEYYAWLFLRGIEEWDRWCKLWTSKPK